MGTQCFLRGEGGTSTVTFHNKNTRVHSIFTDKSETVSIVDERGKGNSRSSPHNRK